MEDENEDEYEKKYVRKEINVEFNELLNILIISFTKNGKVLIIFVVMVGFF